LQGPASQQLLQYAAHCYVQGIKLSTAPLAASGMKARNQEALQASIDLLPRLLHLLSFDDRDGALKVGEIVHLQHVSQLALCEYPASV
jgi:hypothetical protein